MSAEHFEALHPREAGSGKFEKKNFGEPDVSLSAPAVTAEEAVPAIIASLDSLYEELNNIRRRWTNAMKVGDMSAAEVLAEMEAINVDGYCQDHPKHRNYGGLTAVYCFQCRIAMATEHALRQGPEPVPVSRESVRARREPWPVTELDYTYDEDAGSSTTTTAMTGDEAFESAVRSMLGAPAGAEVTVTDVTNEYGDYTKEYDHEITVKAGDRTATFDGLGSLMRALDRKDPDGPLEMALRLMRAVDARRPLLSGPAAIYLKWGGKPIIAHVTQVFQLRDTASIRVMGVDGREQYIESHTIAAITETDQTKIYEEED